MLETILLKNSMKENKPKEAQQKYFYFLVTFLKRENVSSYFHIKRKLKCVNELLTKFNFLKSRQY